MGKCVRTNKSSSSRSSSSSHSNQEEEKMETKAFLALVISYVLYLVVGAAVFYEMERYDAGDHCGEAARFFSELNATNNHTFEAVAAAIERAYNFEQQGIRFVDGNVICTELWDFQSCVFFAGTIITTIGYGHMVPTSSGSKAFCVVFALIGIPIFTILFGTIGDGFGVYMKRFMNYLNGRTENASKRRNAWYLLFVFGSVGFALFSIFPALIFTALEGWPFADSLYFTIITLTTIGFGDLVPGSKPGHAYVPLYRIMVYTWILFGLAYTATFLKVISTYLGKRASEIFKTRTSEDVNIAVSDGGGGNGGNGEDEAAEDESSGASSSKHRKKSDDSAALEYDEAGEKMFVGGSLQMIGDYRKPNEQSNA